MKKKSRRWLALALLIFLPAGLLALHGRSAILAPLTVSAAADKPESEATHPLDPLSEDELSTAVAVLRDEGKLPRGARLPLLALREPPKQEVLDFRPGQAMRREASVVVLDRAANKTYEAVIDLKAKKCVSWKEMPGVQPSMLLEEFLSAAAIVRADPTWRKAMRRRGIAEKDLGKIHLDTWASGDRGRDREGAEQTSLPRLFRVIAFYCGDSGNSYGRPIEGVVATVDMTTKKVVHLLDKGDAPVAEDSGDFTDPAVVGPKRERPKPLTIRQPKGPSFEIHGHEVRWQKWRFRYAMHPREGLVLYTIGYEDGGRVRPILYRASLAELLVPYGDPSDAWNWRNAFDEGEYGLGRLSNSLHRGREVPENAVLLDAPLADDRGHPFLRRRAVALYERDGGMLWTHADFFRTSTRRARQLVVTFNLNAGNYDYSIDWIFNQDGSMEVWAGMNGIVLAKGVGARKCEVCDRSSDADGKIVPDGVDRFGTLVAPNVVAANHQHFFCFRLDFDVDGLANRVAELNVKPAPNGPENPRRNAFVVEQTLLRSEREAGRDLHLATNRHWKIFHPQRNSLGHYPAYLLEPGANTVPFAAFDSPMRRRARFLDHHVWVTRQKAGERYPGGDYPNQSAGGDGVPRWIADNESLVNQDIVLWYTLGVTHIPRVEEWPVMPATRAGFRLLPDGFFTRNPALDVPEGG